MKILLLAGEESGVMYAERIREEALKVRPDAEIRSYDDYGFKIADLAVMGIGQVLKKIFYFARVKRTMLRAIDEWRPDVVCTVDYPGMNLRLAAYAKAKGIRTVHVVCPQVWAWKKGRIPKIEAALDKLCCFFPFEPNLFKPGFAEFVGHPLVDEMAGEKLNTETQRHREGKTLAILPGSRLGEIEKILPTLLQVAQELQKSPCLCTSVFKIIIPAANEKAYSKISHACSLFPVPCSLRITRGGARAALRDADAAIVASGTATLEAALAGCPTVLVYKVGWFFAAIARAVIKGIKHIGLANVIAEKAGAPCPMPELLQENFTVENVLARVRPLLTDASANAEARQALGETMKLLKSDGGAIARIARCVVGKIAVGMFLVLFAAGCSTDKIHEWMRADPVKLTDFLPGNERLVRRPDTFPFHYSWMNTNAVLAADFKNVYIAPFDVSYLRKGKEYDRMKDRAMSGVDSVRDSLIDLDGAIDDLGDYGRKVFIQAFKAREKETVLKVVDDPSLPNTMILELAITAFVPTRAAVEVVGTVGSFFCPIPGVGLVADYLAAGSIAVECRARDSVTKEVVAMFADTEGEPAALLQFSKYTYTSSAKINLKTIAAQTVECCVVEDASQLRRAFPFGFIALPWESD